MLVLSKKIFYAVEAVLYIAYNAGDMPVSGTVLAEAQNLPPRYLEAMLQRLVRAGILQGMRGAQGGYRLGRERRRITLADIDAALTDKNNVPDSATELGKAILNYTASALMKQWRSVLATTTIEQLCAQATAKNIAHANDSHTSFAI